MMHFTSDGRFNSTFLESIYLIQLHVLHGNFENLQLTFKTLETKYFSQLEASDWMAYVSLLLQVKIVHKSVFFT